MTDKFLISAHIDASTGARMEHRRSAFADLSPWWRAEIDTSYGPVSGTGATPEAAIADLYDRHGWQLRRAA